MSRGLRPVGACPRTAGRSHHGYDTSTGAAADAGAFWEVMMRDIHEEILKSMRASPVILSQLVVGLDDE